MSLYRPVQFVVRALQRMKKPSGIFAGRHRNGHINGLDVVAARVSVPECNQAPYRFSTTDWRVRICLDKVLYLVIEQSQRLSWNIAFVLKRTSIRNPFNRFLRLISCIDPLIFTTIEFKINFTKTESFFENLVYHFKPIPVGVSRI